MLESSDCMRWMSSPERGELLYEVTFHLEVSLPFIMFCISNA